MKLSEATDAAASLLDVPTDRLQVLVTEHTPTDERVAEQYTIDIRVKKQEEQTDDPE